MLLVLAVSSACIFMLPLSLLLLYSSLLLKELQLSYLQHQDTQGTATSSGLARENQVSRRQPATIPALQLHKLLAASLATSCNRLSLPSGAENVTLWKLHKLHDSKGKSLHIGAVCCLSSWPKIPSASRAVLKGFMHKSVRPFLSK